MKPVETYQESMLICAGCFYQKLSYKMGCFVRDDRNGMGCFVQGGKNGMGCFVCGVKKWHGMFCLRTFNTLYRELIVKQWRRRWNAALSGIS